MGGKVNVNGARVKPAKAIRLDDELNIRVGPYEYVIRVLGLSGRRGPVAAAILLYAESVQSKAARETLATRLAAERIYASMEQGGLLKEHGVRLFDLKNPGLNETGTDKRANKLR